jgi:ankyrin repeat protein
MLDRIQDGRTDLVFDYVAAGHGANARDGNGVSLIQWCAYYGDVSAMRFLIGGGESLDSLGPNLDLNGAAFHGHWRLCQFLLENGADANFPLSDAGETPLHAALCKANRPSTEHVIRVLLVAGADPNRTTRAGAATGSFMRDARARGETPLHRAAAFSTESVIDLLIDAGAAKDTKDVAGDTPLAWASWHLRPAAIIRKLCYGDFSIHPDARWTGDHGSGPTGLDAALLGKPHI